MKDPATPEPTAATAATAAPAAAPARDPHLAAEARAVLGDEPSRVERLTHSRVTRGVWRVTGAAGVTAIAKILMRPDPATPDAADPSSIRYWLREPRLYEQGAPAPYLAAGVRAPRLLGRFDRPDGDVSMWLEDVRGSPAAEWNLASFAVSARRLGRAQGTYLAGEPLPDDRWLCRDYLRRYLADKDAGPGAGLLASDEAWTQPLVAAPARVADAGEVRVEDRPVEVPQQRRRMAQVEHRIGHEVAGVLAGGPEAGKAPVEQDGLGAGVDEVVRPRVEMGECAGHRVEPAEEALAIATQAAQAIAHSGVEMTGDERLIRLGMCASAVKYDWIAGATLARARQGGQQRIYGEVPVADETLFGTRAAVLGFLLDWAAEAQALAADLGLA